jgi:CBS domain containing-hemolysin-like protein
LVAEELGRVPAQGDVVEMEQLRIVVERVEENRVMQVRLRRTEQSE